MKEINVGKIKTYNDLMEALEIDSSVVARAAKAGWELFEKQGLDIATTRIVLMALNDHLDFRLEQHIKAMKKLNKGVN